MGPSVGARHMGAEPESGDEDADRGEDADHGDEPLTLGLFDTAGGSAQQAAVDAGAQMRDLVSAPRCAATTPASGMQPEGEQPIARHPADRVAEDEHCTSARRHWAPAGRTWRCGTCARRSRPTRRWASLPSSRCRATAWQQHCAPVPVPPTTTRPWPCSRARRGSGLLAAHHAEQDARHEFSGDVEGQGGRLRRGKRGPAVVGAYERCASQDTGRHVHQASEPSASTTSQSTSETGHHRWPPSISGRLQTLTLHSARDLSNRLPQSGPEPSGR